MTLKEKIDKSVEEFGNRFTGFHAQSFLRTAQKELLIELKKLSEKVPTKFPEKESDQFDAGYSQALTDLQDYLEEEIIKIK